MIINRCIWGLFLFSPSVWAKSELSDLFWQNIHVNASACGVTLEGHSHGVPDSKLLSEIVLDHSLAQRIAPISQMQNLGVEFSVVGNHPMLGDFAGKPTIDIPNALLLQYASPILLTSSSERINSLIETIRSRWANALKARLRIKIEAQMKNHKKLAETNSEFSKTAFSGVFPIYSQVDGQDEVLPGISRLIANPDLILSLSEPIKQKILERQAIQNGGLFKGSPKEVFSRDEAKDLEINIQQDFLRIKLNPYLKLFGPLASMIIKSYDLDAVEEAIRRNPSDRAGTLPSWSAYFSLDATKINATLKDENTGEIRAVKNWFSDAPKIISERILGEMMTILRQEFPIWDAENATAENTATAEKTDQMLHDALAELTEMSNRQNPFSMVKALYKDQGFTVRLPTLGLQSSYKINLGTTLVTYEKKVIQHPKAPIRVKTHGDGSTKSYDGSWKYLFAPDVAAGFNPIALASTLAGLGPLIKGLGPTLAFTDKVYREIRNTYGEDYFIIGEGRSSGSTKNLAHAYANFGKDNPIDAYSLMSLSNPLTMDLQLKNVRKQQQAGLFDGFIEEPAQNARNFGIELIETLKAIKKPQPKLLRGFGNNVLVRQGNKDAEGGPTVLQDLDEYIENYGPLIHKFIYYMPPHQVELYDRFLNLKRGEFIFSPVTGEKLGEESFEATHFLNSTYKDNDFSQMQSQLLTDKALEWALIDYLAEGPIGYTAWPDEGDQVSQARAQATQRALAGPGESLFEFYIRTKLKLDIKDINAITNPTPYARTLVGRLAWVKRFFELERTRCTQILRELGKLK